MSNIQSVNTLAPFSAQSLDATNASSDELDPRFVEELQGAMGRIESESNPSSTASDASSQEPDPSSTDPTSSLQNLPLMPWAMIQAPANFAPQEPVNVGSAGDSRAVDALAATGAVDAKAFDAAMLNVAAQSTAMTAATGAVTPGNAGSEASAVEVLGTSDPSSKALGPTLPSGSPASLASAASMSDAQQAMAVTGDRSSAQGVETPAAAAQAAQTNAWEQSATSIAHSRVDVAAQADATVGPVIHDPLATATTEATRQANEASAMNAVATSVSTSVAEPSRAGSSAQGAASQASMRVERDDPTRTQQPSGTEVSARGQSTPHDVLSEAATATLTAASSQIVADMSNQDAAQERASVAALQEDSSSPSTGVDPSIARVSASPQAPVSVGADAQPESPVVSSADASSTPTVTTPTPAVLTSSADATVQLEVASTAAAGPSGTVSTTQQRDDLDAAIDRVTQARSDAEASGVSATAVPSPAISVTNAVTSTSSTPSTAPVAQEAQAPAHSLAMTTHKEPTSLGRENDVAGLATSVSSAADRGSVSLASSASSQEATGTGIASHSGRSAESTFASSFVQALMGHVHQPTAAHSQALEVVPTPAPIAPHQVRLDAGQVQVEVVRLVKQGGGQVVMELTPPDESKFKIDLSISQQGVARLVVDGASESTRLRLEQTVSGLQDQFQQMGLQLQLDMRQPQQRDAQTQPDVLPAANAPSAARAARQEALATQPVTGRPAWEQGQVYLVA